MSGRGRGRGAGRGGARFSKQAADELEPQGLSEPAKQQLRAKDIQRLHTQFKSGRKGVRSCLHMRFARFAVLEVLAVQRQLPPGIGTRQGRCTSKHHQARAKHIAIHRTSQCAHQNQHMCACSAHSVTLQCCCGKQQTLPATRRPRSDHTCLPPRICIFARTCLQ